MKNCRCLKVCSGNGIKINSFHGRIKIFTILFMVLCALNMQPLKAQRNETAAGALENWKPFEEPSRGFDPKANLDLVPESEFEVGEDSHGPIVRVNMLKIKDFTTVPGINKVFKAHVIKPTGKEVFSNMILSEVIDIDGKNTFNAFSYIDWSKSIARYDDNGKCLWLSDSLPSRAGDESRLPVLDIDADGTLEVISTQKFPEKGGGMIVCLDAETGKLKWKKYFKGKVNKENENPFVVGHFSDKKKYDIVALFDNYVYCVSASGELRWKYQHSPEYEYGHELYWYDVDGDGLDEIFVSTQNKFTALRGDGTVMWQDTTSKSHSDFIGCGDMDADGQIEVVYDHDGCGGSGPVYIVDALTGKVKSTIDYRKAGISHAQGGVVGKFRSDVSGLQVFINEKINGVAMFDAKGNLLWKNNAPGSLASSGDWDGDGVLESMCFALGMNRDGIFSVWDGYGKRKYAISFLPGPIHVHGIVHAAPAGRIGRLLQTDITGDNKADVLMSYGRWGNSPDQYLFIMGEPKDK